MFTRASCGWTAPPWAAWRWPRLFVALANATSPGSRFFDLQVLNQGGYMSGPGGLPLPGYRWMALGVDCGVEAQEASQTVALRAVAPSSLPPSPTASKRRIPRHLSAGGEAGLTLSQATALALQGVEAARRADVPLSLAILDHGAHVKVLLTMDGVPSGMAAAAMSKVRAFITNDNNIYYNKCKKKRSDGQRKWGVEVAEAGGGWACLDLMFEV